MKAILIAIALSIVMLLNTTPEIWAQENGQLLQEVFQTELVFPQEAGEMQFTLAPRLNKRKTQEEISTPFVLEYGLTDAWQIDLEWIGFTDRQKDGAESVSGIGDLEIGSKLSFMDIADSEFHTAIGFEIGLPIGDEEKGFSEGGTVYEPLLIFAKDLPAFNNGQIFTQIAIGFSTGEEESEHELNWNSGFFVPIGAFCLTTELNWSREDEESQIYFTPGLVWDLPFTWEFGIGVPVGISGESDDFRIIGMLTYEFNIL